ncbi:uncharacterized protein LOC107362127 [Tetranychus urticae]|uniref:uncharacterized protein LOC107362127 n=1 Tax=Tetranychus urticae TaxID=32264 RepID=UPI00077BE518|nr:uncharacterized protein LOC107362127 [Tetranychus urticae]
MLQTIGPRKTIRFCLIKIIMALGLTESISGFSGPIAEEMLPSLQSMGWSHNDSLFNCQDMFCNLFDEIGPPPDWLPPPPPLPPHLLQLLNENHSLIDERTNDCNFCHIFSSPMDSELVVPKPEFKPNDSWFSLLLGSIIGSTILCIILLFILFKFRKRKLFPSSVCGFDSCPIFPESMMRGIKTSPPPCAPSDNYISPVVNEKSPQSVITNCPTNTSISSKYWRRSDENRESRVGSRNSREADMEDYTNIPGEGSCTSSPVYAELDAAGVNISHSQIPSSLLLNGPSPYVVHTYSEVADAMRMAALGSSTALLPDTSYDNVAYLPTSNSDHYQGRSLRRQRSGLGHLGTAAPLLSAHQQMIPGSQMNFASSGRPHKKPRPVYSHRTSRINVSNHQLQQTTTRN